MSKSEKLPSEQSRRQSLGDSFDPKVGHPKRYMILSVMCLSLVVIVLDNSILNVAIPTISRTLGATDRDLLWIIDIYTLVFAGLLLTAGTLGDKFGRRKLLQIGLFIFGIASIMAAIADTPTELIVGRGLMGIGGAAIMPSTLSIITNVFPAKERGRAIGIWAAFAGLGAAIGPLTGGFLLEHFWWGSVFIVNIPIVFIGVFANLVLVPESKDDNAPRIDIAGAVLSIVALSSLLYAIIVGADVGYSDTGIIAAFIVAGLSLAAFFIWEAKIEHPMLRLEFFKDRRFSTGALSITLIFFAMFGMALLLTQYLQLVLGYSPLQSGAGFIPFALTMFVTAPLSAKVAEKIGTKVTVVIGLTLVAIGLLALSTLAIQDTYPDVVWMFIVLAAGMGLTMAPSTSAIMNSLPREQAGIGSAMNDTTRMVGGALGLAIIGSIASRIYTSGVEKSAELAQLRDLFKVGGASQQQTDTLFNDISDSFGKAAGNAEAFLDPGLIQDATTRAQVESLPEGIRETISETIYSASRAAFVDGMSIGMRTASIAVFIAIIIAAIWMPQRSLSQDQSSDVDTKDKVS